MIILRILTLIACLLPSVCLAAGSRTFASGDYLDAGTATNTAAAATFTVAGCFNVTSITGADQVIVSRIVTAGNNGWEMRIKATTGVLMFDNNENQLVEGTSTTAVTAGTWQCAGMVLSATGSTTVHMVRYTPSTGVTATEDVSIFYSPSPSGTQKLLIGGRWVGSNQFPFAGSIARVGVWSDATAGALTDTQLRSWFCATSTPSGADGLWVLNGTASPEPDTSGNAYDATLSGTSAGSAVDACPSANQFFRKRVQ